jgi:hypothetical protein
MTMKFLLHNEKGKCHAQNSTFASPDTQADASACKRAVFLPALGAKIVHLRNFKNKSEC